MTIESEHQTEPTNVVIADDVESSGSEPTIPDPGPETPPDFGRLDDLATKLSEQIATLERSIEQLSDHQPESETQGKERGLERKLLSDLQSECTALRERFHEREVLWPIFRSLIGVADRCREQTAQLKATLRRQRQSLSVEECLVLRSVVDGRHADEIEINALLATLGVASYRQEGDRFTAASQKCVKRIPTRDRQHHQRIAERIQPGYRREATIVRPEYVSVYVHTQPTHQ